MDLIHMVTEVDVKQDSGPPALFWPISMINIRVGIYSI